MTDGATADRAPTSLEPTASPAESRTTAEPAPPVPFSLAPVPGLQTIGDDAVGLCGPDGCFPAVGTAR